MKITEVRMRKVNKGGLKAVASIVIDNSLALHDFKVMESTKGLFVSMPSKKVGDKYIDISNPITADVRNLINSTVLEHYKELS